MGDFDAKELVYKAHGEPDNVLYLDEIDLSNVLYADDHVLVRWMAAPINPSDLAQIEGEYLALPELPAVAGNEACGVVEESALLLWVGSAVVDFAPGDWVVPRGVDGLGTWRTHGIHEAKRLFKIPGYLDKTAAATLLVNPPTAYRLLKDFVDLQPKDAVVLNGANSAVGRYVVQFCRMWGLKSIGVVRDRPEIENLKNQLRSLGADEVYTQEEFVDVGQFLQDVRLALDCVGGSSGAALALALQPGGTFVQYGWMSGEDSHVTRKGIRMETFSIDAWYKRRGNAKERTQLYEDLARMMKSGALKNPSFEEHSIEDSQRAIRAAQSKSNCKQLFVFN